MQNSDKSSKFFGFDLPDATVSPSLSTASSDILQESFLQHFFNAIIVDTLDQDHPVDLHCHNFWEMSFCLSGSVDYLIKDERYVVAPSDIILIPPNITHRPVTVRSQEPFQRILLCMHPDFVSQLNCLNPAKMHYILPASAQEDPAQFRYLFETAFQEVTGKPEQWEHMLNAIAIQLVLHFSRAEKNSQISASTLQADLLDQVLHYMSLHFNALPSSADIAAHFHISDSHLRALFKKRYGISIHKFMVQQKMSLAKNLIVEGHSMNEICETIGFQDYSSFYKAFRAHYGISPSAYKNMQSR